MNAPGLTFTLSLLLALGAAPARAEEGALTGVVAGESAGETESPLDPPNSATPEDFASESDPVKYAEDPKLPERSFTVHAKVGCLGETPFVSPAQRSVMMHKTCSSKGYLHHAMVKEFSCLHGEARLDFFCETPRR